jgi:hypothetical protein
MAQVCTTNPARCAVQKGLREVAQLAAYEMACETVHKTVHKMVHKMARKTVRKRAHKTGLKMLLLTRLGMAQASACKEVLLMPLTNPRIRPIPMTPMSNVMWTDGEMVL